MNRTKVLHRFCLITTLVVFCCILSWLSPSSSLFADIDHDEESSIPEQSAAAREAELQYTSAYNKLTSLMADGKGDTPEAKAAHKAYLKEKAKYEAILKDEQVVTDSPPSKTIEEQKKEAYQQYMSAYNKCLYLMDRHEGDTPLSKRAYEDYKEKKDRWEAIEKVEDGGVDSTISQPSAAWGNSNWWMFMHDPQHTGRSPYQVADKPVLKWKFNMRREGAFYGSASIGVDGTIYCGNYHYFYALNPDGSLKWKYNFEDSVSVHCTPAIGGDGTIYFGTTRTAGTWRYHGAFYALTPDGNLKWKHNLKSRVLSSPAIGPDGTIYVAEDTGAILYAFDPDGTVKGKYAGGGYLSSFSPAIGKNGTVYFPTFKKLPRGLAALNQNCELQWEYTKYHVYNVAIGSVYDGGRMVEAIYFGSEKYLCALNTAGQLKWKCAIPSGSGANPAVGWNGVIYLKGTNELYAIHPKGCLLWKYPKLFKGNSSPAIDADGTIIIGNTEGIGVKQSGAVYALNPDGSLKWRYPMGAEVSSSPTITADGTILIGCSDGYLYAIGGDKTQSTGGSQGSAAPPLTLEQWKKQFYEDYMKAYNHFTTLISQGKKGTVEANDAFKEYNAKKAKYEKLAQCVADTTKEKPSSLVEAYQKYIAAYKKLTGLVVKTSITGPPEMKKLSERYREARDEYNKTKDKRAYQESIAIYNQLTSQSIKIEFTGPDNLRRTQQDYFNAKTEYDRLVKESKKK